MRGEHVHIEGGVQALRVLPHPRKPDTVRTRPVDVGLAEPIGPARVERPGHDDLDEAVPAQQTAGRREQLGVPLRPNEPPDGAHHDIRVSDAELTSYSSPDLRRLRMKPSQVDPIAQESKLLPRNPEARQSVEVLLVLDELDVAECGRRALRHVDGQPSGRPVACLRVQAVLRIDDQRHACGASRDPADNTRLRIVGVHYVRAESPEQPVQLEQADQILVRGDRAGRVAQRVVGDPVGFQPGGVATWSRRGMDFVPCIAKRAQLRAQEELEAYIGGGDVQEPGRCSLPRPGSFRPSEEVRPMLQRLDRVDPGGRIMVEMALATSRLGESGSSTSETANRVAIAVTAAKTESPLRLPMKPLAAEDFDELLRLAERHRILGALAEAVHDGLLPVEDRQHEAVSARHRVWAVHCLQAERLLCQAHKSLQTLGLELRVLKGPALARIAYDDPAWRVFSDVDILVPSYQLDDAVGTLISELGAVPAVAQIRPGFDREFGKDVTVRVEGLELDVHRTFVSGPFGLTARLDRLFEDRTPIDIGSCRLSALGSADLFLHACFEAALGDYPLRLGALRDLVAVHARVPVDGREIAEVARSWRASAVVRRAARLACEVLELDPRHGLQRFSDLDVPRMESWLLRAYLTPARSYTRPLASVIVIPGVGARVRYALALAFPSREYLRGRAWTYRGHVRRAAHRLRGRQ